MVNTKLTQGSKTLMANLRMKVFLKRRCQNNGGRASATAFGAYFSMSA